MAIRGVRPGEGTSHARSPEPISRELRANIAKTKAVVARLVFVQFQAKTEGYTKGPPNIKDAKKANKVFNKYLP